MSFREAHKRFEAVSEQYADYGASDTEPRCVFYSLIESIHRGVVPTVPSTVNGWDLYDLFNADQAAAALYYAATAAVEAAKADAIGVAQFVNSY
jgi:hypothetical protein